MLKLAYRIGIYNNPLVPSHNIEGIFPVLLNEKDEIVATFKHPDGPRNPGNMEGLKKEIAAYADSVNQPTFNVDNFSSGPLYWSINGWDGICEDDRLTEMIEMHEGGL